MLSREKTVLLVLVIAFILQVKGECGGDPNAIPGCMNSFCLQRCDQVTVVGCGRSCVRGGCRCDGVYKYDMNLEKCVPPQDCSSQISHPRK